MTTLATIALIVLLGLIASAAIGAWDIYWQSGHRVPALTYKPDGTPDIKPGMWGVASMGTVYVSTEMDSGPAVAVKRQETVAA